MNQRIAKILKSGGIGVLATDTIYGLVCSALDKKAIERVYKVRNRNPNKLCIILISSIKDLAKFDIRPNKEILKILHKYWFDSRRPTSIVVENIAFRLPKKASLIKLLKQTGPLIAPSANPEGLPPATTITKAKAYFGDQVDFYSAGRTNKKPSRLIKIENGKEIVLRK